MNNLKTNYFRHFSEFTLTLIENNQSCIRDKKENKH